MGGVFMIKKCFLLLIIIAVFCCYGFSANTRSSQQCKNSQAGILAVTEHCVWSNWWFTAFSADEEEEIPEEYIQVDAALTEQDENRNDYELRFFVWDWIQNFKNFLFKSENGV